MKKLLLIIIPVILLTAGLVFAIPSPEKSQSDNQGGLMDKKILVAYFSWSGNTKTIAEKIHDLVGGDIFSIEPVTPYPSDYNETAYGIAKEQKEKGIHPPIHNTDISAYNIVFVGTPAWWYTMAPPVMTFLSENNFEGKTIIPFITHGGGGGYTIDKDMGELAKGSTVLKPFVVYSRGNAETNNELKEWLKSIKFLKGDFMKKSLIALLTACLLISCGTLTNAKTAEDKIMKEKVYYTQPKEYLVIPNATHMEMYYKPEYVTQAVDKLTEFYGKYLGLNEGRDK